MVDVGMHEGVKFVMSSEQVTEHFRAMGDFWRRLAAREQFLLESHGSLHTSVAAHARHHVTTSQVKAEGFEAYASLVPKDQRFLLTIGQLEEIGYPSTRLRQPTDEQIAAYLFAGNQFEMGLGHPRPMADPLALKPSKN